MSHSKLLDQLTESLCCLPGIGPKSAQRIAFHLLERDREGGRRLSEALATAMRDIGHCRRCRTFADQDLCTICQDASRDSGQICVVENPIDAAVVESSTVFRGSYFVLMGKLSPLDGIGPEDLGLDQLRTRLSEEPVQELIVATNPSVEGEATAHYLAHMARSAGIRVTRIAHGVPLGGELEYIDSSTLAHAFSGRREVSEEA
ncbi:MAG: recombination mediator RecR [Xanthomonadales bacterium]|nr:recombination mediator RecR [Xanthomonadales bacterium]